MEFGQLISDLTKCNIVSEVMVIERRDAIVEESVNEWLLAREMCVDEADRLAEIDWWSWNTARHLRLADKVDVSIYFELRHVEIAGHLVHLRMLEERAATDFFGVGQVVSSVQIAKKRDDGG
jgi:hypothetical protein